MIIDFSWAFIIVIVCAAISFIGFLGSIATTVFVQHFNDNPDRIAKVTLWTVRFNFLKNLFWQWTIYLFAFVCLVVIILNFA